MVWTPRGFLPSKIQIWTTTTTMTTTTTSDSLSAAFALTRRDRVCGSVRARRRRVRAISNGDQSPSNRGRTMRVAPPESGRPRESYCCHPRCLSSPASWSDVPSFGIKGDAFGVIQARSFDMTDTVFATSEISPRVKFLGHGRARIPRNSLLRARDLNLKRREEERRALMINSVSDRHAHASICTIEMNRS